MRRSGIDTRLVLPDPQDLRRGETSQSYIAGNLDKAFPPDAAVVVVILVTDETITTGAVLLASFLQPNRSDKNSPVNSTK